MESCGARAVLTFVKASVLAYRPHTILRNRMGTVLYGDFP